MHVDEAMEEARQFGEQKPKDMLFGEHIAILLATEVERLRAELADTENARDSWRSVCEKETEAKHQAWAKLSAVRAELEKIVGETIKRNGWGAE